MRVFAVKLYVHNGKTWYISRSKRSQFTSNEPKLWVSKYAAERAMKRHPFRRKDETELIEFELTPVAQRIEQ